MQTNELMELFEARRTYRRFEQKPVPQTVIDDIVEALRLSSSGMNRQAMRLLIVQKSEDVKNIGAFVKWAGRLPAELGTPKANETPTLYVALLLDTDIAQNADTDAGIALANMTLVAAAHGVGSCILGAINRPQICELLNIPEKMALHTMIAFGYPAHKSCTVPVSENTFYYVDENVDYYVPKHSVETLATYF